LVFKIPLGPPLIKGDDLVLPFNKGESEGISYEFLAQLRNDFTGFEGGAQHLTLILAMSILAKK
jgi:hypothetical protein